MTAKKLADTIIVRLRYLNVEVPITVSDDLNVVWSIDSTPHVPPKELLEAIVRDFQPESFAVIGRRAINPQNLNVLRDIVAPPIKQLRVKDGSPELLQACYHALRPQQIIIDTEFHLIPQFITRITFRDCELTITAAYRNPYQSTWLETCMQNYLPEWEGITFTEWVDEYNVRWCTIRVEKTTELDRDVISTFLQNYQLEEEEARYDPDTLEYNLSYSPELNPDTVSAFIHRYEPDEEQEEEGGEELVVEMNDGTLEYDFIVAGDS